MNTLAQTKPVVCVVNDDRTQLLIWSELLKKDGLQVHRHHSAEAALQELQAGLRPDLVVTDLHMPNIDGWRFCRLLRSPEYASFNQTPILVISATFSGEDALQITAALGANAFLSAPFEPGDFLADVHKLLRGEAPKLANRVLIVEDEQRVMNLLKKTFGQHGYVTSEAYNGREALKLCREQKPEIVVLDFHLPDIEGDFLLGEICKLSPHSAVVMITGDPRSELAVEWMKRGARAYVQKPFDAEYLIALCEKARRELALLHIEDCLEERTQALRESEERWRNLVESLTDALFVAEFTDEGVPGHFLEVNNAACQRLGYTREELLHLSPVDLDDPASQVDLRAVGVRLQAGQNVVLEVIHRAKDGRRIPVEICSRLFTFHGRPAVVAVARDITERRKMEAQIQQTQKLESLGVVAGGIAHDFNNILMTILGNIEIAQTDLPPNAPQYEPLEEANKAALQAADLCRQMLAYSGRGKFVMEPVCLNEVIHDMSRMLESSISKKATLRQNLTPDLPAIEADVTQIRQIIMNLVINAAEALGEHGGYITLSTAVQKCNRAMLAATWLKEDLPAGNYVCLEVTDTGCGMDSDTMQRVFDPFFTTKFTGRGLGLAAVLGIVRGHKGALSVDSAPGRGTIFRLFFPVMATPSSGSEKKHTVETAWHGTGTILLVDDEAPLRDIGRRMLTRLGFQVLTAANGKEALQLLQQHIHEIKAVVLDLTMPHMDGVETLTELRRLRADLPVLMASGYSEQELTKRLDGQRIGGFIQKPYKAEMLRAKLHTLLEPA